MSNAFEFNPLWPTRTDPLFVVRTLEQSAGTNLDTDQSDSSDLAHANEWKS